MGRLRNSEIMLDLNVSLSHLSDSDCGDLIAFISSNKNVSSDVHFCTTLIAHDIDVGDYRPIKQHAHHANPPKCIRLKKK